MKITLIATHQITKDDPIPLYGCLGVLALAAAVKQQHYLCEVLDLVRYCNLANEAFEPIADEIVHQIIQSKPDIVGFSNTSDSLIISLELGKRIKNISPKICIVFGGPGVSYCSHEVLSEFPIIDYLIRGEADYAFPDFITAYKKNNHFPEIKGLIYRKGEEIVDFGWPDPVTDLDLLPIPAYEYCQNHEGENLLFDQNYGYVIEAGRGCPYNCNFCSTSQYFKRKYRVKSVDRLVEEIRYVKNRCKDKRIRFSHDLLTYKKEFIENLCKALIIHFSDLKWGCDSRLDTIDPEMLKKMAIAGCSYIYMGIEVATEKMQKVIGKRLDLSQIDSILHSLKEWNYNFVFSFVVGLPEEEISDIEALYSLAMKAKSICSDKCLIQMHLLRPELGSRIYNENKDNLIYTEGTNTHDSAVALQWFELRKMIQNYPEIFPRFFTLKNKLSKYSTMNSDPSTYTYFVYLIQVIMKNCLIFAFRIAGNQLSKIIVKCFNDTSIKGTNKFEEVDFGNLLELIRESTVVLLHENTVMAEAFNSIAKYEIAVYDVSKRKSSNYIKIIDIYHSEKEILNFTLDKDYQEESPGLLRHLMFIWDNNSRKVKCKEISHELVMMGNS